jgi:hypothetical protein
MEVLINELSLTGQFRNKEEVTTKIFEVVVLMNILQDINFTISTSYDFYTSKVLGEKNLALFLHSEDTDEIRGIRNFLLDITNNPPFWNETQQHNCLNNSYVYNANDICHTSLAESCERDKIILSFNHSDFLDENLKIQKNSLGIDIYNILNKNNFLDYLLANSKIEAFDYSLLKFERTNLNFSLLEEKYGFSSLETTQQLNEFLNTFNEFSQMSWEDIENLDGLKYKRYKPNKKNDWFRNTKFSNNSIYKFRISQEYRCFGYRKEDEFFVLRFEIGHKISDNG